MGVVRQKIILKTVFTPRLPPPQKLDVKPLYGFPFRVSLLRRISKKKHPPKEEETTFFSFVSLGYGEDTNLN
jgi:hypothetical protein